MFQTQKKSKVMTREDLVENEVKIGPQPVSFVSSTQNGTSIQNFTFLDGNTTFPEFLARGYPSCSGNWPEAKWCCFWCSEHARVPSWFSASRIGFLDSNKYVYSKFHSSRDGNAIFPQVLGRKCPSYYQRVVWTPSSKRAKFNISFWIESWFRRRG